MSFWEWYHQDSWIREPSICCPFRKINLQLYTGNNILVKTPKLGNVLQNWIKIFFKSIRDLVYLGQHHPFPSTKSEHHHSGTTALTESRKHRGSRPSASLALWDAFQKAHSVLSSKRIYEETEWLAHISPDKQAGRAHRDQHADFCESTVFLPLATVDQRYQYHSLPQSQYGHFQKR